MKRGIVIVGAVFAVALAVVIGTQMSADAMAVVVGVMCGVSASIPTSLLLIWALGRRGQTMGMGREAGVQGRGGTGTNYPPVVVVNPGPGYGVQGYRPPPALPPEQSLPAPGSPRTFKVVGDEETMLDELHYFVTCFFADILILRVAKPNRKRVTYSVVEYLYLGHTCTPSLMASVG
jgi:hypothetical protein